MNPSLLASFRAFRTFDVLPPASTAISMDSRQSPCAAISVAITAKTACCPTGKQAAICGGRHPWAVLCLLLHKRRRGAWMARRAGATRELPPQWSSIVSQRPAKLTFWREQEGFEMARFGVLFKYSGEGYKGFLKDKAAGRVAAIEKAAASAGGSFETVYWIGGGEYSGFVILNLPDMATYTAFLSMTQASGMFASDAKSFELLTTEEMDQALNKTMSYRAPGG
jgi:uncharacterized protein with GYD domain